MVALEKQYNFYQKNKSALINDYAGMYLVITDGLQVHPFATLAEAYQYGAKNYGLGKFMIQECTEAADQIQMITNINPSFV